MTLVLADTIARRDFKSSPPSSGRWGWNHIREVWSILYYISHPTVVGSIRNLAVPPHTASPSAGAFRR